MSMITVTNLSKVFAHDEEQLTVLNNLTFAIEPQEYVAITGQSGSGKSTLMHILGCLDIPTSGTYQYRDQDVGNLTPDQRAHLRNQQIGFVFQRFYLLKDCTALENVMLPQLYGNVPSEQARMRARELLDRVELSHREKHYPYQLSGGQQQRVAIARALANKPSLILADEPTGNLDSATGQSILALFQQLNTQTGTTIIIVTHAPAIAEQCSRSIELADGKIIHDTQNIPI